MPNVRAAVGLRTVDGSFNNLVDFGGINQTEFGAADNVFPRLTDPVFNSAENVSIDLDGPGPSTLGAPTSYQQTSGFVFDSQPRTISATWSSIRPLTILRPMPRPMTRAWTASCIPPMMC